MPGGPDLFATYYKYGTASVALSIKAAILPGLSFMPLLTHFSIMAILPYAVNVYQSSNNF